MHYFISLISSRFDKSPDAGRDNVNNLCGADLIRFVAQQMGYQVYDVYNEDYGRVLATKADNLVVEIIVVDLRPGEVAFGGISPIDGPNWAISVETKRLVGKRLFLFPKYESTEACAQIGKTLEGFLMANGDKIITSELASA
ncbi:MAG TPA: hypothetical protein VEL07_07745 [Planctomycetota bacterium]|nr:hypothetical protein [Planctomycetota bacterium]